MLRDLLRPLLSMEDRSETGQSSQNQSASTTETKMVSNNSNFKRVPDHLIRIIFGCLSGDLFVLRFVCRHFRYLINDKSDANAQLTYNMVLFKLEGAYKAIPAKMRDGKQALIYREGELKEALSEYLVSYQCHFHNYFSSDLDENLLQIAKNYGAGILSLDDKKAELIDKIKAKSTKDKVSKVSGSTIVAGFVTCAPGAAFAFVKLLCAKCSIPALGVLAGGVATMAVGALGSGLEDCEWSWIFRKPFEFECCYDLEVKAFFAELEDMIATVDYYSGVGEVKKFAQKAKTLLEQYPTKLDSKKLSSLGIFQAEHPEQKQEVKMSVAQIGCNLTAS